MGHRRFKCRFAVLEELDRNSGNLGQIVVLAHDVRVVSAWRCSLRQLVDNTAVLKSAWLVLQCPEFVRQLLRDLCQDRS